MSYHFENLALEDAMLKVPEYEYAVLYNLSSIRLCEAGQLTEDDWKECVEARVFRSDAELHMFPLYEKKAYLTEDTGDDADVIESAYSLSKQFRRNGKSKLIVKRYLCPDDDGQLHIELTRLAGLAE